MRVKGDSLFGKLVTGLAGIFLLFVFIGCEKEKSVAGPTAFNASETSINDATMAQSTDSISRTFSMDDYKPYTGTMYVTVDPSNGSCQQGHSARIIWGPWQTDEVPLGYSNRDPNAIRPIAITFKKKNKDSVPLTVIVKECDSNIYDTIKLYTLRKGKTISTYYVVHDRTKSGWTRR